MKEDLAHDDETKREKSMDSNGSISRKVSHRNYDQHGYDHDVPTIPTHGKSFNDANRMRNKKEKTMKEIWAKQNLFSNKSSEAMKSKKPVKGNQKQKQGFQERKKQLDRNFESRKLNSDNASTTIQRLENNLKSEKGSQKKSSEDIEKTYYGVENRRVESYMNEDQLTGSHYPFKRWQCKNDPCLCDSKPSLPSNIEENLAFLFEVSMLSDSDKLRDVDSAQYKAACWVLYDDTYKYDLADERVYKRMMQRYILAVFYFAMTPENWKKHSGFLSYHSECDWNYSIRCDEDDNVIKIDLSENNLEGTIVEELSGLRMLEELSLYYNNNIRGFIPSVLGRLSELRYLDLSKNDLGGMIPETIGNLKKLIELRLYWNNLSGSIPYTMYSLKNLKYLYLDDNKLSSSMSTLIGNLNKLEWLSLHNNMLTGQIPSTIGSLSSLWDLFLYNNRLSGSIPESLYDLPKMRYLNLQDNSVTGSAPDEFCERFNDNDFYYTVQADCRNDVFDPEVRCSCCVCKDESPIWDGDCADSTIKVMIDHEGDFVFSSSELEWSLTNDATREKILYDGPHVAEEGLESYKACVAYSDCFSFNQISPPVFNTNYHIYWNNNSIHNGTFLGYMDNNNDNSRDDLPQTLLSFSHNEEDQQVTSCHNIKLECYEEEQPLLLEPNTTQRIMYNQAIKTSGRSTIQDSSSPQSKALCWMVNNNYYENKSDVSDTVIIQRYVLAILHFMSQNGLFVDYDYEYPPVTHECDWNGITCKDYNTKIVTGISLSSEDSQIINGTLIEELGSLHYLEVLELNQTQLQGTIPRSFSNLWSLTKLDLSGNKISSTIPATLFRQLNKLEYIDLSNNKLRGSINDDIGSFSRIRLLSLNENELTGSLPLEGFKHYDLEHLNVGGNELSEIDFSLLLKHNNMKFLDISDNIFVGSLLDDTFTSLAQLRYFNLSQNYISGTIPSTFPEQANMSHFDLHANKLRGRIPPGILELQNIQHINLQGNKLTGSLPSELNQLKSLNTLVLSHNELKGSIPFDPVTLKNIEMLHLHSNKFEGEAPDFNTTTSYISDCGFPSDLLLKPVVCPTCNMCCNSDGKCQSKSPEELSQVVKTPIFYFLCIVATIVSMMILYCIWKNKIASKPMVIFKNALRFISDKSASFLPVQE